MPISYINKIVAKKDLDFFDATKPLPLKITLKDIKAGEPGNSKKCPFAIAAKRVPGVCAAYVLRTKIFLQYRDRMVRYQLPMNVRKQIALYDSTRKMNPGDYQLKEVDLSNVPSVQRKGYKKRKKMREEGKIHSPKTRGAWPKGRTLAEPK